MSTGCCARGSYLVKEGLQLGPGQELAGALERHIHPQGRPVYLHLEDGRMPSAA